MAEESRDWVELLNTGLSRRTILRGGLLGGAGLAAAALIGCGDDDDDDDDDDDAATPAATATAAASGDDDDDDTTAAPDVQIPEAIRLMNEQAEKDGAPYPYAYADPPGEPKEGGVLKVGVTFDVGSWDISKSQAGGTTTVPTATYNRLLGLKHGPEASKFKVEFEPELAHSWENTPDGLQYTFNLVEGVKFQNVPPLNGRDFSSEDVLWAFQRQSTEGVNTGPFNLVTNMDTPDPNTFTITISTPSPDFLIPFAIRWMGIYPRELVEQDMIDTKAIGTGPLIVTEVEEGSHIIMETNPDYWEKNLHGRGPWLDGMEFRIMQDQAARLAALRTGQIDFAYGYPNTPSDAKELLDTNPDFTLLSDPILINSGSWGFNQTLPKFMDPRVRAGIQMSVNRPQNVQILYDGIGTFLPTAAWPFVFDQTPTVAAGELGPFWEYNPEEAKKLLIAAGQEDLTFDLLTTDRYNALGENELIQEQLRQNGVTVNFNVTDYTEFNAQWVPGEYAESADGWATSSPSADGFYFDQVHSESAGNRWFINDAEIDDWAERQQVELDPDARRELQRNIWDKLLADVHRLESVHTFPLTAYAPHMRFARFNGAYISYHYFYRFGDTFQDMWLDK